MSEWIKANQSWMVILSMLVLFLMLIGIVVDFQKEIYEIRSDYTTQKRFYHYNGEQDTTSRRIMTELSDTNKEVSDNKAGIAFNKAKIEMIIN